MGWPVLGAVLPLCVWAPRVRIGSYQVAGDSAQTPGMHSSGAGPGPGHMLSGFQPSITRTLEPFLREGRKEGICHICVLGWPPSLAATWGMHREIARRLLEAS